MTATITPRLDSRRSAPRHPRLRPTAILGLGSFLPEAELHNEELAARVGTTPEWIRERTGIHSRRVLGREFATSDMAFVAAERALQAAGLPARDVELIVVATVTPDHVMPSTAALVQHRLGAKHAAGFDLGAACTGFAHALMTADAMVQTGRFANALVIGADTMSRIVNPADRDTSVLFGDGAGAVLVGQGSGGLRLVDHVAGLDGAGSGWLTVPCGGSRSPADSESLQRGDQYMKMDGRAIFRFAIEALPRMVTDLLARNDLTTADLDLLVPHQANLRILEAAASRLGLPMSRVVVDLDRHGNTCAATLPLALERAIHERRLQPGDRVCLAGFGAGMSWGASLLEVESSPWA